MIANVIESELIQPSAMQQVNASADPASAGKSAITACLDFGEFTLFLKAMLGASVSLVFPGQHSVLQSIVRLACGCSAFGSMRDDCEQTTGRCVCKQAVSGMKCDACSASNHLLQPSGCVGLKSLQKPPKFCNETTCYFSAKCQMIKNEPQCVCPEQCNLVNTIYTGEMAAMKVSKIYIVIGQTLSCIMEIVPQVCGSDGVTYGSVCQLQSLACKMQKDIVVVSLGTCNGTNTF